MADLTVFEMNNTEYGFADTTARGNITTIDGKIPSNASSSNKLSTASDLATKQNKLTWDGNYIVL